MIVGCCCLEVGSGKLSVLWAGAWESVDGRMGVTA